MRTPEKQAGACRQPFAAAGKTFNALLKWYFDEKNDIMVFALPLFSGCPTRFCLLLNAFPGKGWLRTQVWGMREPGGFLFRWEKGLSGQLYQVITVRNNGNM